MTRPAGLVLLTLAALLAPAVARAAGPEENYRFYCVQCHGSTGNGKGINVTAGGLAVSPRDHSNAQEMAKLTDEELRKAIAEGGDAVSKSELMPPWRSVLSETEITEIVVYLRRLCRCTAAGR
jgi:mono/diheme cytochrome c family protein